MKNKLPKFSIIIPTYKHLDDCLKPCCESIIKCINLEEVEVLIVANGCGDDGTREYVKSLGKPFKLVWIEEQLGYTKSTNIGIKKSKGKYIVLLNNDTVILDEHWEKNTMMNMLLQPFLEDDKVGITGCMKEVCPEANREFLLFFCVMIARKVIDKIGILDECFAPAYGEDTDFCCRAVDVGFKIKQVPIESREYYADKRMVGNFPLWHIGNHSYKNWEGGNELIARNNNILRERYNKVKGLDGDGNNKGATGTSGFPNTSRDWNKINIESALKCDGFMSELELIWLAQQATKNPVLIELGSWHGRSTRALGDNTCGVVYAVDTWKGSAVEQNTSHASAKNMDGDAAYYEFLQNNIDLIQKGKIIPLRMSGDNAARFLKEKNIQADMVFIDAGHTYDEVKNDINSWLPIVKKGSVICGHDYVQVAWMDVKKAVDDAFPSVEHITGTSIWSHIVTKEDFKSNVFDCFPINNELGVLEIRLSELWNVVDRFIIIEADKTHGNKPKPYYFRDNLKRFEKYLSKISHVMISDYNGNDSWSIERHQRDCIMRALTHCKDDDTIIISDLDEIPSAEAIKQYKTEDGIKSFEMDLYYYNMSCRAKDKWTEAKILPYGLLKTISPCGARYTKAELIPNGGKHLSYFGGAESIRKKIEDTAHQEYNKDEFKDLKHIEKAIKQGTDLFGRNLQFEKIV